MVADYEVATDFATALERKHASGTVRQRVLLESARHWWYKVSFGERKIMNRTKLSRILVLWALVLGAALAAPCALSQQKTPLRFGMAMPLTGSQSAYGLDFVEAARWAVADINAKGGVNGHPLEMIVADTLADPQAGISAATRLINVEKVPLIVSAWSGVVKAVAPLVTREKVLVLAAAGAPELAKLGDYVYTVLTLSDVEVSAIARYAHEKLGKKRAAVLYINNETGVGGARAFRSAFEKAGGQVVAYEAYDAGASDFSGAVLKVRAANVDVIHIQGLIVDMPQVMAQIRQLGMTQLITSYSGGYSPKLIEQLGSALEPYMVTSMAPGVKDNPNVAGFIERWQKTKGRVTNALPYTQYIYDSPYLVAELYKWTMQHNLPATGENLRKAMLAIKKFDFPMTGALEINEDHEVKKPVYLLVVEKGKFVPLATVK